ncbi:glycosyltransferase, partial [Nostoc sp. NIES-2111]
FALCGQGAQEDIEDMEAIGLSVFADVPEQKFVALYAAADGYMSLSRWEGYNLRVGQALAMGLPVIASDIPAHREFRIPTEPDVERVVEWLAARVTGPAPVRSPVVYSWDEPTGMFADILRDVCAVTSATARKDEGA